MGIGTDIIEISRIEKSIKSEAFLKRVFSERERELIEKKGAKSAAANFAAKEAFSKALGTGVRGFSLCEVEVLREDNGKPYIVVSGRAKDMAAGRKIEVSLSHTEELALAFVVIEG